MQHTFMTYVVGFGFIALLIGLVVVYHLVTDRRPQRPAPPEPQPRPQAQTSPLPQGAAATKQAGTR